MSYALRGVIGSADAVRSIGEDLGYIEAECWDGQCEHGAVVFQDGEFDSVGLGAHRHADDWVAERR